MVLFTAVAALLTVILGGVSAFVEFLGFASLLTEASLGVPQWLRNYEHKSTEGMRFDNRPACSHASITQS
jgi:hypothetical protein